MNLRRIKELEDEVLRPIREVVLEGEERALREAGLRPIFVEKKHIQIHEPLIATYHPGLTALQCNILSINEVHELHKEWVE